ncbi:uncharacterized protein JCM6883_001138 [Sporobolomyces salmoneus]|uniref:uncharacterized protein n=1 Tax=Sporobolomyces salmoneus TaxID=183962 RepID=UPI003177B613
MPELPEVEAARSRLERAALGKKIVAVVTNEDPIVYSGCTDATFATAVDNKTVKAVKRLGKNFYMILSSPPHPIFHFGMSGMAHVRGEPSPVYRVPRSKSADEEWPPKYMKCCLTLQGEDGTTSEWAFCDPRRLGRIKLVDCEGEEMEKIKPLSDLGADPYLNMPSLDILSTALLKRHAPIKAVLLDQSSPLCGIGNYMVDEILYQSALHPSHPASALSTEQLATLHDQIQVVTNTAVAADADASRFPSTWLFSARWNKGKKVQNEFILPDGSTSTISFVTVGGRTSAIVDRVQILPEGLVSTKARGKRKKKQDVDEEEAESEQEPEVQKTPKKKRRKPKGDSESTGEWKVQMIEQVVTTGGEVVTTSGVVEDDEVVKREVETETVVDRAVLSPYFKRTSRTKRIDYKEEEEEEEG